jgi:hypothetical protein
MSVLKIVVRRVNNEGDQIKVVDMSGHARRLFVTEINSGTKYKIHHK